MSDEDFLVEIALLDALLGAGNPEPHWVNNTRNRVIWHRRTWRFECVGFGDFWIEPDKPSLYIAETVLKKVTHNGNGWIYHASTWPPAIWPPVSSFAQLVEILRGPAFRERYDLPPLPS